MKVSCKVSTPSFRHLIGSLPISNGDILASGSTCDYFKNWANLRNTRFNDNTCFNDQQRYQKCAEVYRWRKSATSILSMISCLIRMTPATSRNSSCKPGHSDVGTQLNLSFIFPITPWDFYRPYWWVRRHPKSACRPRPRRSSSCHCYVTFTCTTLAHILKQRRSTKGVQCSNKSQ